MIKLRTLVVVFFLANSLMSFSQEIDECRKLNCLQLNIEYRNEDYFNSYTKNKNLYIETEQKLDGNSKSYLKFENSLEKRFIEGGKDSFFNIVRSMNKYEMFDNCDIECCFKKIYLDVTYITLDYVKIKFSYEVNGSDVELMKDRMNKTEFSPKYNGRTIN